MDLQETNVKVFDTSTAGLGGSNAIVQVTGGELARNFTAGTSVHSGSWSLTNVAITDNPEIGVSLSGPEHLAPGPDPPPHHQPRRSAMSNEPKFGLTLR